MNSTMDASRLLVAASVALAVIAVAVTLYSTSIKRTRNQVEDVISATNASYHIEINNLLNSKESVPEAVIYQTYTRYSDYIHSVKKDGVSYTLSPNSPKRYTLTGTYSKSYGYSLTLKEVP